MGNSMHEAIGVGRHFRGSARSSGSTESNRSNGARGGVRFGAMFAAAAIALTGIVLQQPSPAQADDAVVPGQQWVFDSPSGTDWTVPAGVDVVLVGLRGGAGGNGDIRTFGSGSEFAVRVPVKAGDVLKVYAGKSATGKGDYRIGGAGFINGGNGGKGTITGGPGGGGGGASAVKLNGELIAVAGGGGGGGGYTGKPNIGIKDLFTAFEAAGGYKSTTAPSGSFTHVVGGEAGSNWRGGSTFNASSPKAGGGSTPGAVGENGKDDSKFAGYHKSGVNGGAASFMTGGGGGGAGGGGWPSSGTGGGGGRKFQHYSGGSGGGAGMSWVKSGVPGLELDTAASRPEDMHTYFGPLADSDTVKIFIPIVTVTKASAPAQVYSDQSVPVRVLSANALTPNTPLKGYVIIYDGNRRVAGMSTNGDQTVMVSGLTPGTHTLRAEFTILENHSARDYLPRSSDSVTVEILEPVPVPEPDPVDVETNTSVEMLNDDVEYGGLAEFSATVILEDDEDQPGSGIDLSGQTVEFVVDGTPVGTVWLSDAGEGTYETSTLWVGGLGVGTHQLIARFSGMSAHHPALPDALASESEPVEFTIERAQTRTEITSAPASVVSFVPVDVSARVLADVDGFDGSAALLADGAPIAYADLDASGEVTFASQVIPWGTAELSVAYLGDTAASFAVSSSDPSPIEVTGVETTTTLSLSSDSVRADGTVAMSATVLNVDSSIDNDPSGQIEILFDGEVVYSVPAGLDVDPEVDDGEARYELDATGLLLGTHQVTARFVPAPGFLESSSAETELLVTGIETTLVPSETELNSSEASPASVELHASIADSVERLSRSVGAEAGDPVDGYVQAYLGDEPFGDIIGITDGEGSLSFAGLPVGKHAVELRFVPGEQGMLKSSATVQVTVTSESGSGAGGDGSGNGSNSATGSLSNTGGTGPLPVVIGGAMLLLAAVTVLLIARRRKA